MNEHEAPDESPSKAQPSGSPESQHSRESAESATPPAQNTSTGTHSKPAPPTTRPLPRWRVLLHNDDVNEMQYVVNTIINLTRIEEPTAVEKTVEAHKQGLSLLLTTHQERAELFQQQFQSANLTVTIEPEAE